MTSIMRLAFSALLLVVSVISSVHSLHADTAHGILITIGNHQIELAVGGPTSFRVSIAEGQINGALTSPMVEPPAVYAPFNKTKNGDWYAINTTFGKIEFNDKSFETRLFNGIGEKVASSNSLSSVFTKPDEKGVVDMTFTASGKFYGSGGGAGDDPVKTQSFPEVQNTKFQIPYYWNTAGYSAFGVTDLPHGDQLSTFPASWQRSSSGSEVTWKITGQQADLYLMVSDTPYHALDRFWDVTGRPQMLPRYAFGFLVSRWGWENRQYIDDNLKQFRSGNYPIDAFISDFEWYTNEPDYDLNSTGLPTFEDFGYNNVTFPAPQAQLKEYHNDLHLRFGGIRKPRLGNSELLKMAKSNGWLLNDASSDSTAGRNLNFSIEAVRDWYDKQQQHYLTDGVDFWWNDEGETDYFTFYFWNIAHYQGLSEYDSKKRYFTINRSYSPGMQRLGTCIWTGDVGVSWKSLSQQPGYLTNWNAAGVAYVTHDIGGFSGPNDTSLLITRWYQLGVFMDVMRVHSTRSDKPHFPFLYGKAADDAMRKALELRYRLVAMHYSLAYDMYYDGRPIFRPLYYDFGDDDRFDSLTSQWMDGDYLMVSPITNENNSTTIEFPQATWYEFNSTKVHYGNTVYRMTNVPLDHIPMFVRQGGIIPLAPVVQYTDMLPGGPLEIQVYDGAYGTFTLVEDDGETKAYRQGLVRRTLFQFDDQTKVLSWDRLGDYEFSTMFKQFTVTFITPNGITYVPVRDLTASGSIKL